MIKYRNNITRKHINI